MENKNREIKTVMHTVKLRKLTVKKTELLSKSLKRITLTGDDLEGFVSMSPDDHVKAFFAYPGEDEPVIPSMLAPDAKQDRPPIMRDYTPRRYNAEAKELEIDFVLHGKGPGSQWAQLAEVGSKFTMGGPRGSKIVPYEFDWYLMIGDETSLPSFARRLEEIPSNAKAVVFIQVKNESEKIQLQHGPDVAIHWVFRNGNDATSVEMLKEAVLKEPFPSGDYFSWIGTEKGCAMELKSLLLDVKGAEESWIKATGYWKNGEAG
ncbi:siderophore-interacting protein [Bdellovibrio sp. GT3]|uniref:siderophore-interacting protein n=1 Tax=Bdellovibrio sp. GT3 TaxID=3136282 RepID=UPI0030F0FF4A